MHKTICQLASKIHLANIVPKEGNVMHGNYIDLKGQNHHHHNIIIMKEMEIRHEPAYTAVLLASIPAKTRRGGLDWYDIATNGVNSSQEKKRGRYDIYNCQCIETNLVN